jgi:V-type ATPase 116kDa subunit family
MRSKHEFDNVLAAPLTSEIDELAKKSGALEQRISSLNENYETLKKRESELIEWRWVLREAGSFFDRVGSFNTVYNDTNGLAERIIGTWQRRRHTAISRRDPRRR